MIAYLDWFFEQGNTIWDLLPNAEKPKDTPKSPFATDEDKPANEPETKPESKPEPETKPEPPKEDEVVEKDHDKDDPEEKDDDPVPAKPDKVVDDSTPTGKVEDTEQDKEHKQEATNPTETFDDPKFRDANGYGPYPST